MTKYSIDDLTTKLYPVADNFLTELRTKWYNESQSYSTSEQFIDEAQEWFKSTRINDIQNWNKFECVDIIMGCTHFIESLILKHGWDNIQILHNEYGYYGLMGKHGIDPDQLKPEIPLIVSLPNFSYADIRPEWETVLKICEQRNIDIHIDFAWILVANNIQIDVGHPNIKSFAMSLSKYNCHWNRIGLRWSKQRTMDSVNIMTKYYGDVNSGIISCGNFLIRNIPRDYTWNTYGELYHQICSDLDVSPTKLINVVKSKQDNKVLGIGNLLTSLSNSN
jgi:hypothetical protein